jgi:hypothetical protein
MLRGKQPRFRGIKLWNNSIAGGLAVYTTNCKRLSYTATYVVVAFRIYKNGVFDLNAYHINTCIHNIDDLPEW